MTPLDIKKQEFTRSFRGVDAQEVYNFLQMVGDQWNNLLDENRRLEQKVREFDSKLEHYRKIEEALQEALETARDNSHKTIENAQREAQIILKEARSASEEIRKRASGDHKRLKHDITKISGRRDEIVARLRAFLMSEMELLARFEGQDPMGFVRLDAGHSKQLRARMQENEVNINASYQSQHTPEPEPPEPAVDLPIDEEEVPFEEEMPLNDTFQGAPVTGAVADNNNFDFELTNNTAQEEELSSSEGLSTDELEFIKTTVSTATQNAVEDDIFKPAEPEIDEAWQRRLSDNIQTNGQPAPANDGVGRQKEKPAGSNTQSAGSTGAGWIVKPINKPNVTDGAPPSPSNPPNLGGFASPLFGPDNDQDDLSATPEEIEKIRRILNDLD